jgi:hypothetical protein
LIPHGTHRKRKYLGDTERNRQQGDVISLITKIRGHTQRDRQKCDLIGLITIKNRGIHRQMDTDGYLVCKVILKASFYFFKQRKVS